MAVINLQTEAVRQTGTIEKSYLSVYGLVGPGAPIQAAHINSVAGHIILPAPYSGMAIARAGRIWGTGFGDHGYGMTSPLIKDRLVNDHITSSNWNAIRTAIVNIASWQNTAIADLIPTSVINVGDPILSSNLTSYITVLRRLEGNRFDYQLANMTLTSNAASTVRATSWSTIDCSFLAEQTDENKMRYFFNTGGEYRISFNHANTSSSPNVMWGTALNNLVVAFRANKTVQLSGAFAGTASNIGYYQLTETYQTIFDGSNISAYAYNSGNTILIQARSTYIEGQNGAKGRVTQFKITLTDNTGAVIASGTTAYLSHLRATTTIVIPNPTCTVEEAF